MFRRYLCSLLALGLVQGCSLDFNTSLIPADGGGQARDGSSAKPEVSMPTGVAPVALWWFAEDGSPPVIPDRAAAGLGIDLFPVLSSDVGRGQVQRGVWLSNGGELRSDAGLDTKLGDAIKKTQAFSLEAWAEVDPALEGKGSVIGCDMFDLAQTSIGTEMGINTGGQWTDGAVTLLPPTRLRHIVGTYSAAGGISRIYLDGTEAVAKKVDNGPTAIIIPEREIHVSLGSAGWSGKIHLGAIYDRELSPADIRALFALGPGRR